VARRAPAPAPEPEPEARRLSTGEAATPALLDGALTPVLTAACGWLLDALAADTAPQVPRTVANATSPMMIFLN